MPNRHTCDRKMCDRCATSVGEDKDYCPNHNQARLPWDKEVNHG
jgi:RNA polymerase subunit RPABC4/transcription elongation factor Spt4